MAWHRVLLGLFDTFLVEVDGCILVDASPPRRERSFRRGLDRVGVAPGDISHHLWRVHGLPIFAEHPALPEDSWRRLLAAGVKAAHPARGAAFPVAVMERVLASR